MVAVPYVLIGLLLETFLRDRAHTLTATVILVILFSFTLLPLYAWVQNAVDHLFFRERYDNLRSLQRFGREIQSITDLGELTRTLTTMVSKALRTPAVSLFLASDKEQDFRPVAWTGTVSPADALLEKDGSLVNWLVVNKEPLDIEAVQYLPELLGLSTQERQTFNALQARLCVPLITQQGILSGVLILGPKRSEQPYSGEDRELIISLGNNMAMAIENASLYQTSLRELDERKRIQESLRESEERYRALVENADDFIFMVGRDLKILSMNRSAGKFLGAAPEEFTGKSVADIFPREAAQQYLHSIKRVFGTGATLSKVSSSVVGEHEITLDTVLSPIRDSQNQMIAVICVARNITERKEAESREDALLQRLNLANRLATIGTMAAGIAHEINNPLTAVIGFSDLLSQEKDLPDNIKEPVSIINTGAQRVADIVRGLLIFSRQQKPERKPTNVNSVLMTSLGLRSYVLKTHNIDVETNLDPALPLIMADAGQLQQVFINIIMNAESAMLSTRRKGHLGIKTEIVEDSVRISVSDDGVGISEEHMQKLFHPFFTTKEVGQGTGLGLSICHGIITGHGGQIYAKSTLGTGTTFFIDLPVNPNESIGDRIFG